ncbi:hypothetical protein PV04_02195 [Phialophora macrospora]|uniref:Arrestin-like N-terminal domain-containing protein n=1 Tax=Phialophora macrospora TaxID=1851006 RepID=A0A0D2FTM7_9EURO|nr:hypothetical protein PV04_02195 [Phialophora macrospora]
MFLSVLLSPTDGEYRPGSAVRGTVFLTSLTTIAIDSISVTLTGSSRVTLTQNYGDLNVSNSDYHSRVVLFQRNAVLYTGGKWTHQAGQYSWEFEIEVPSNVERRDGHDLQCPFLAGRIAPQGTADAEKRHLPPSMLYTCRGFGCQVEYVLEATLMSPADSALRVKTLTAKTNILLQPDHCSNTDGGSPDGKPYIRHEQIVQRPKPKSNPLEQTPLSRLLRLSKSNQPGPKPDAPGVAGCLKICVLLPKKIDVSEDYSTVDIMLSAWLINGINPDATSQGQSSTQCAGPTFTMKEMKIAINQFTHVRAGQHTSTSTRKTYTRKTTCSLPIRVCRGAAERRTENTEAQGVINLGQVTELRIAKDFLVVDFATNNISIKHALDLELGFEYDGKGFEFVRRAVPIRVVALSTQSEGRPFGEVESRGIATRPSNRAIQAQSAVAQIGREEDSWLVPPPEPEENGVLGRETDAWCSVPPPRYMLRAS